MKFLIDNQSIIDFSQCVCERQDYQAGADVTGPLWGGEALTAAVDAVAVGAAVALGAAGA